MYRKWLFLFFFHWYYSCCLLLIYLVYLNRWWCDYVVPMVNYRVFSVWVLFHVDGLKFHYSYTRSISVLDFCVNDLNMNFPELTTPRSGGVGRSGSRTKRQTNQKGGRKASGGAKGDRIKLTYFCDVCPFKCQSNSSVKRHYFLKHSNTAPNFACRLCSYTAKLKYHMTRHVANRHLDRLQMEGNTDPLAYIIEIWSYFA